MSSNGGQVGQLAGVKPTPTPRTLPDVPTRISFNRLPSTLPSPLPLVPIAPAQIASLRGQFHRRRSSYPPVTTPGSSAGFPWVLGGTPSGKTAELIAFDNAGFGTELSNEDSLAWDALISFDQPNPAKLNTRGSGHMPLPKTTTVRAKSEVKADALPMSPGRIAQFGSDLAWKTILGSVVEVEGVGEVGVCRVLLEVWKRGGGETVTSQCLWPSIIVALSLPSSSDTSARTSTPSAQSAMSLQGLYNLTLKQWEPSIFSGLLTSYMASNSSPFTAAPTLDFPPVSTPKYGASTPTKEFDLSLEQWTNLTPGLGGELSTLFGSTPRGSTIHPSNLGQFEFHVDNDSNRNSIGDSVSGIEEILANMEKEQEEDERKLNRAASLQADAKSSGSAFQLPTPETDSDATKTPRRQSAAVSLQLSPDSTASPFIPSGTVTKPPSGRAAHPTSLAMPTEAFVPPPPMCMFFNPSFRDLQKGKVGVWKGDLSLRGKGGGTFNVLIVGEEVSGHLWQSHLWSSTLTYPVDPGADNDNSSFTSKMIPVAYLAREGFTPVTMGMVLCNDANIEAYVAMVQHLHAEGVAFHLPNAANLPIVFLPAKFDPNDPLQRLGIAYMTKPGAPIPLAPDSQKVAAESVAEEGPKRKKRRQSAPAKQVGTGIKRKESLGLRGKVEEEVIVEEKG